MAEKESDGRDTGERPIVAKTAVDLQRLKLLKLMKNPNKPVLLPERPRSKNTPTVPEFVRNVMGSSAGAGSGEFHVYRHLRRKEYSRQKFIQEKGKKELLDDEYHKKLERNKEEADKATAKKRAKRMKRKQKQKVNKKPKLSSQSNNKDSQSDRSGTSEEDSDGEKNVGEADDKTIENAASTVDEFANLGNSSDNGKSNQNSETQAMKTNSDND